MLFYKSCFCWCVPVCSWTPKTCFTLGLECLCHILLTGVGGWNGVSMKEILIACIINTQCNLISGMVGDEGSMPKSGILESPNYPHHYPNDHDSTQTVEVAEGKTIRYRWTDFQTEGLWMNSRSCSYDWVEIVDEDGTSLMSKRCGSSLPSPGTSNSNIMHVKFHTDGDTTRTGWRLEWTEQ